LSGDDVSLNVYDPNSSRSDTVTIGFKLSSPREPITSNVYLTGGLQVRGFFRLPYSLASPPLIDDAELEYVAFSPPTVTASRSKFSISVTARNIGSTTWNAAGPTAYRLGSQLPQDNSTWGVQRAELTKDVAPRQKAVFDVAVTAPDLVGPVEMGWRMVHELVRWFGQTVQASVSVGEPEKCISIRSCIAGYQQAILSLRESKSDLDPQVDLDRQIIAQTNKEIEELEKQQAALRMTAQSIGCGGI
jgi:hypothetical protein